MPYKGESASKGGHSDLVRNPDVKAFLEDCVFMRQPSDKEGEEIAKSYIEAPTSGSLPDMVVASDASPYSDPIDGKFPSTQVGYVKASLVLIKMTEFNDLTPPGSRFVDPFKLAALHRNADSYSFSLPGSNIRYKGAKSVQDGFRRAMWDQLSDTRTRFSTNDEFTVRGTLLALAGGTATVLLCPSCGKEHASGKKVPKFTFVKGSEVQTCPDCKAEVYLTDTLRIHEQITDFGDCTSAITRFMNAVEQLLVATFVRMLAYYQPKALANMAFILDGPLAVFGQPASLSFSLVTFYHGIGQTLAAKGLTPPIILGLQKEGQVMEHARSLKRFLGKNTYRIVDDAYRDKYINSVNNDNFGTETYFGQDFILRTEKGDVFVVGIPYPAPVKSGTKAFAQLKADVAKYGDSIGRAFDVIRHFELDLYGSAVIPVALAHRHASISITPGGRVLDLVTKNGLAGGA